MVESMERLDIGQVNLVLDSIEKTLNEKNRKYGNSALEPVNVFSKDNATVGIRVRLDDKVNRLRNNNKVAKNDLYDILGYSFLLIISESESYNENCDTFAEKVAALRRALFSFIDQTMCNSTMNLEHERNSDFHIFKDEVMNSVDGDALTYLKTIETNLAMIRKTDKEDSKRFVWGMMMSIIAYFVSVGITDFSDLID